MTRQGEGGGGGLPSRAEGTAAGAPTGGRANASRRRGAVSSCGNRGRWVASHAAEPEAGEEKTCPVRGGGAEKRITDERRARNCEESGFYAFYAAASVTMHVIFRNSFILS